MKEFFWGIYAAMIREILKDQTSVVDLTQNIQVKMDAVVRLLHEKNPELFAQAEAQIKNSTHQDLIHGMEDFLYELLGCMGEPLPPVSASIMKNFNPMSGDSNWIWAEPDALNESQIAALSKEIFQAPKSSDCVCPNLLAGHLNSCIYAKRSMPEIIQRDLGQKLGPQYAEYAKTAALYAVSDTRIEEAKNLKAPFTEYLNVGDLILVEESAIGELAEYRNVEGPWVGVVTNAHPTDDDDIAEADEFEAAIIDSLGNKVGAENFWLTGNDRVYILRRTLQSF